MNDQHNDPWSLVRATENLERRRFDPLIKSLSTLTEEKSRQLLSWTQDRNSDAFWRKVLIPDSLFELDWISELREALTSVEEDLLWDDIQSLIRRRQNETAQKFGFLIWSVHIGRRVGEAWRHRDAQFFQRHAGLWDALCTAQDAKARAPTHTARICRMARELRDKLDRDPTKKELRHEVAAQGMRISEKDWPKYFRKCHLTFLPAAKSGRPKQRNHRIRPEDGSDG